MTHLSSVYSSKQINLHCTEALNYFHGFSFAIVVGKQLSSHHWAFPSLSFGDHVGKRTHEQAGMVTSTGKPLLSPHNCITVTSPLQLTTKLCQLTEVSITEERREIRQFPKSSKRLFNTSSKYNWRNVLEHQLLKKGGEHSPVSHIWFSWVFGSHCIHGNI